MKDTHERPVCHRSEDLVSYLYGEAPAMDAVDFRHHLQQCDACRSEFTVFNQVHDSIQLWRDQALGASFSTAAVAEPVNESTEFAPQKRRLSAIAALREFFSVSPLWLRGATTFAALLLFVLGIMVVVRLERKPVQIVDTVKNEKLYTQGQLQDEVNKAVERTRVELASRQSAPAGASVVKDEPRPLIKRPQVAANQPKSVRPRGLNRQEREQLAADLRLTSSADDEDSLLAFPEQENPNK
jgi:hypothetical protein